MGRDKALLETGGTTLLERTAKLVREAAGSVTVIGGAERYRELGFTVVSDLLENCGPIGGLYTALCISEADWNLIVACDMPGLTADFLRALVRHADGDGLVPQEPTGRRHPLCAVYHRRIVPVVAAKIAAKQFALNHLLDFLQLSVWPLPGNALVRNVNTPSEWAGAPTP